MYISALFIGSSMPFILQFFFLTTDWVNASFYSDSWV